MAYTREDFLAVGIDPDSQEAYELNQEAELEDARSADPNYGTRGTHTPFINQLGQFGEMVARGPGAALGAEFLAGLGGGSGFSGSAQNAVYGYSPATAATGIPTATTAAMPAALPTSVYAGGAGTGVGLSAPAAAASAAPIAAGAAPASIYGSAAGGLGGPTGAGAAGGTIPALAGGAASGGLGLFKQLLIGTGLGLAGSIPSAIIQSRAASKAQEAQEKATAEALQLKKEMYAQNRADQAPYRALGGGAASTLGALFGLPAGADTTLPSTTAMTSATPQQAQQAPMMAPVGPKPGSVLARHLQQSPQAATARSGSSMVRMRAPDGSIGHVPQERVQQAISMGGEVL